MSLTLPTNRILYLLAAVLLLMQSFAIWHDAEHSFHLNTDQCQRFSAFNHVPTLDIITLPTFNFTPVYQSIEVDSTYALLPSQQREAYAIRAPPSFFIAKP